MSATTMPYSTFGAGARSRLVRAWLFTGVSDAIWAMVATVFVFHRGTAGSVWRGVASVLLGKDALTGGVPATIIGLVLHFGVAFAWSAIFLLLVTRSPKLRAVLDSPYGILEVAAVYGPFIWAFMSFVFIPVFTHRMPTVTINWWIQAVGHIVFVGLPLVWSIGSGSR
ncbi:MAG: hypothetical protein ABIT20_26205 [Gemmatimonadaceae bacterium]